MSAFGGALDVHTHKALSLVGYSGRQGRCEVLLIGFLELRYLFETHAEVQIQPPREGRGGQPGRRKPESEASESVSLCATGRHPDHGRRGLAEGVSGAPRRGRFSP